MPISIEISPNSPAITINSPKNFIPILNTVDRIALRESKKEAEPFFIFSSYLS